MYPSITKSASAGTSRSQVTAFVSDTGCFAEKSGEEEFVDRRRQRRARRIHRRRIGAERDADGHLLAALRHLAPVRGADLVALPVHGERVLPRLHDAIHADVADAALRIARDDHRERDVRAAVLGPALHERQLVEIDLVAAPDDLLARRVAAPHARRKLPDLEQSRQHRRACRSSPSGTFISSSSVMRAPTSSSDSTPSDMLMRRIEPKRLMPTGNAEREPSISTGVLEQQRLAAAGLFHHAVGDLAQLEIRPRRAA